MPAMGSSVGTVDTRFKKKLRDTSSAEWSEAVRIDLLNDAHRAIARWLSGIPGSGRFIYQDQKTLAANASTIALSTLTKTFSVARDLYMITENGRWLPLDQFQEGDENLVRTVTGATVSGLVPPRFRLRETDIVFLPVSSTARTIVIDYNWLPAAVDDSGDSFETPTEYDDFLILRALRDALGETGELDTYFERKYIEREAEIESFECNRMTRGVTETVKNITTRMLF